MSDDAWELPTFESDADPFKDEQWPLTGFFGREAVSELYEFVFDLAPNPDVVLSVDDLKHLHEKPAKLTFNADAIQSIHGCIRRMQRMPTTNDDDHVYRLTMVPRLWRATRTVRSRVFQDVSVVDLLDAVLEEAGLDPKKDLVLHLDDRKYPKHEYVVQYEESNFAFLCRRLEHEGIFFFFEQDADKQKEILHVADKNDAFIEYDGELALMGLSSSAREQITSIEWCAEVLPETVIVRDYNWERPDEVVQAEHPADQDGFGYVYAFGEGTPISDRAKHLAKVRAEEIAGAKVLHQGTVHAPGLRAGQLMELKDGGDDLNKKYIILRLEHGAGSGARLESRFVAMDVTLPFRPTRVTAKPRLHGLVTGIVDGSKDETSAPIDAHGRYRVVLPLDAAAETGGKASRWIRRAQILSGDAYGVHYPLHIGAEVVIAHLNGDPDEPIIVGAVPNGLTVSPVVLDEATKSIMETRSGVQIIVEDDARLSSGGSEG